MIRSFAARLRGARLALPAVACAAAVLAVPATASAAAGPIVISTVGVGDGPLGAAVNPATNDIYVVNAREDTVSDIDGWTNAVTATIPVGTAPHGVAIDWRTGYRSEEHTSELQSP